MRLMRASAVVAVAGFALLLPVSPTPDAPVPASADAATGSAASDDVVVNEFAPSGLFWSTDEFVELRNTGDQVVELDGWELVGCLSPTTSQVATWFGSDDEIPPGGYLLLTHPDYAAAFGPAPDGYYDIDVPDDGGWLLYDPWSGHSDGVGLASGLDCTEGELAPECDWAAGEAVNRNSQGNDSDDNATDFTCQSRTPGA
jgi:hypothetical protein